MNLYDITSEHACAVNLPAKTREEILQSIAKQAKKIPVLDGVSEKEIYDGLLNREAQGSTGFGGGIAIPHARFEKAEGFAFFIVTTRRGVDFDAMDKKKVKVFFVLLGPADGVREHLQVLAAVSNVIAHSNVTNELRTAATRSVVYEIFLSKTQDEKPAHLREKQKLLQVILYEDTFFYDLLEFYIEEGIDGATVIESSGMGQYISNIPLFASFIGFMNEDKNRSRTIIAMVPESRVDALVQGIERITGDLDKKQGAMILVMDVGFSKGTMKMM